MTIKTKPEHTIKTKQQSLGQSSASVRPIVRRGTYAAQRANASDQTPEEAAESSFEQLASEIAFDTSAIAKRGFSAVRNRSKQVKTQRAGGSPLPTSTTPPQHNIRRKVNITALITKRNHTRPGPAMISKMASAAKRVMKSAGSGVIISGGATALSVVFVIVILAGSIAASPFGILLAENNVAPDTVPIPAAISQVLDDLNTRLEAIQTADSYDNIIVAGEIPNWEDILAVFAVKVAGTDSPDAADVVTMDADRIARLKNVFEDMCVVTPHVEVTHHPDSDPDDNVDDSWTEKDLTITVASKSAPDMVSTYGFSPDQISALEELLLQRDVLSELAGSLTAISTTTSAVLKSLPEDLPEDREAVIRAACSLVGKVNYFWGGKSHAIGWDDRWGQIYEVTSAGSPTTGTYRPYGMDCSGYVDWVFNNALGYLIGHGGGAMMQHSYCSNITWEEAQIGDLVFYPGDEHVGIVAGWDESGDILIVHCASGYNNVVVTGADGFTSVGRPACYSD